MAVFAQQRPRGPSLCFRGSVVGFFLCGVTPGGPLCCSPTEGRSGSWNEAAVNVCVFSCCLREHQAVPLWVGGRPRLGVGALGLPRRGHLASVLAAGGGGGALGPGRPVGPMVVSVSRCISP